MNEVIVVHVLCVKEVAVLFLAQILWVDAIGTQKLLVRHTEAWPMTELWAEPEHKEEN